MCVCVVTLLSVVGANNHGFLGCPRNFRTCFWSQHKRERLVCWHVKRVFELLDWHIINFSLNMNLTYAMNSLNFVVGSSRWMMWAVGCSALDLMDECLTYRWCIEWVECYIGGWWLRRILYYWQPKIEQIPRANHINILLESALHFRSQNKWKQFHLIQIHFVGKKWDFLWVSYPTKWMFFRMEEEPSISMRLFFTHPMSRLSLFSCSIWIFANSKYSISGWCSQISH